MRRMFDRVIYYPALRLSRRLRTVRLLHAQDWARESGYDFIPFTDTPAPMPASRVEWPSYQAAVKLVAAERAEPPSLVRADQAEVVCWDWARGKRAGDEKWFVFSRRGDLKIDDVQNSPYWLHPFPFVRKVEAREASILTEIFDATPLHMAGDYFFLGGRSHYGHWFVDHLASLWFLSRCPQLHDAALVVNRLTEWQRESIRVVAPDRRTVELDTGDRLHRSIIFERLWVPSGPCLDTKYRFLRSALARQAAPAQDGPKRVYLSRARLPGKERVKNESELVGLFRTRGFEIVFPEQLNLAKAREFYGTVEIMASAPGSGHTNFFLFAPDDAVLINFWPDYIRQDLPNLPPGALYYGVPFLDRTITIFGVPDGEVPGDLDRPEVFPPHEVELAINRAEAQRARPQQGRGG
jgi:hypothetical protein